MYKKPKKSLSQPKLQLRQKYKFLGIFFQHNFKWNYHIETLSKQLSKVTYGIKRLMEEATVGTALTMYYIVFHSRISCGVVLWEISTNIDTILKLQKKCVRMMCKKPTRTIIRELFQKLGILTVTSLYILSCVLNIHDNKEKFLVNGNNHE